MEPPLQVMKWQQHKWLLRKWQWCDSSGSNNMTLEFGDSAVAGGNSIGNINTEVSTMIVSRMW